MSALALLTGTVMAPVACGLLTLALPRAAVAARVALATLGPGLAVALLAVCAGAAGTDAGAVGAAWMPGLHLDWAFHADRLGMFFALLVAVIGLFIVLYARAYFGPAADALYRFYPSLLLFMTAMLGLVLADNFMLLLLFWELTSISSFLLIGWERDDPAAVRKAMQAFVVTGAGGLVLMAGLILLGVASGAWSFSELMAGEALGTASGDWRLIAAYLMIFAGAAAKSAQFPLHFWLPGAMAAPTPVSAYLHSATMVKAGVYLMGRLAPLIAVAGWTLPLPHLLIALGAITMAYGAFVALQKDDLKQIFAYSTVSQLGLLMCMYGLAATPLPAEGAAADAATPNLIWDVSQVLNHALYKAPLFILAGAIGHVASRNVSELRGFFWQGGQRRIMAAVMVLAAYAMAAGPFTVSFTAKEFFFYQIWYGWKATHSPWFFALMAAGVATGMLNVAIFLRLAAALLGRPAPTAGPEPVRHHAPHPSVQAASGDHEFVSPLHAHGAHDEHHETGLWPTMLWIPGLLIVAFQYLAGVVPGAWEALFGWLEPHPHYFAHFPMTWDLLAHPGVPLYMSLAAIGLGVLLGVAPLLRRVMADPFDGLYPRFYLAATQGGGRIFRLVQTGHARTYMALVLLSTVLVFVWSIGGDFAALRWPAWARFEPLHDLLPGYLVTALVCLSAVLLPVVRSRAVRVLVLGAVGFSVAALFYLYAAPDLALTQISIEIVSLVLFLLVLSLLPDTPVTGRTYVLPRLALAVAVGAVMFWVTLTSTGGARPGLPYATADGQRLDSLGQYFLRNSYHGIDAQAVPPEQVYGGVMDRGADHRTSFGSHPDERHEGPGAAAPGEAVVLHKGGGGTNVVNVALVDFRGLDTMGEITVLGLAALGVWTLLRRRRPSLARALRRPMEAQEP